MVLQLPGLILDWYKQFQLEEGFGFNKSPLKLWVADKIKENILGLLLGILLFALIIWLFRELSNVPLTGGSLPSPHSFYSTNLNGSWPNLYYLYLISSLLWMMEI